VLSTYINLVPVKPNPHSETYLAHERALTTLADALCRHYHTHGWGGVARE
jgi:hypothetical protein